MSKKITKFTRTLLLSLCIALLLTNALILAPVVGAASDTKQTETEHDEIIDITRADDVLTQRAIAIDEAKKEAEAAVNEQLAIIAEEEAKQAEEEEKATLALQAEQAEQAEATEAETASSSTESSDASAQSSSTSGNDDSTSTSQVSGAVGYGYLMDIDNPDPNYVGYAVSLSDTDRDLAERMIMGEAGSTGYTGMALVAQCIRDTYVTGGYSSISQVLYQNGYYGSTSITPSATCKEVVSYIFDQGGSAVQHKLRVFYASNYCTSSWHEAQNFVCAYGYVRFFDC